MRYIQIASYGFYPQNYSLKSDFAAKIIKRNLREAQ